MDKSPKSKPKAKKVVEKKSLTEKVEMETPQGKSGGTDKKKSGK